MHKRELTLGRRTLSLETGKLAKQADGAVIVRYGDTIAYLERSLGHPALATFRIWYTANVPPPVP